jgi:hypothetical protein
MRSVASCALAALEIRFAGAGVDDHELGAGVHHDRRIRNHHLVLFAVERGPGSVHLVAVLVDDEGVREAETVGTIGDDGDFVSADLVAIEAGVLLANCRRRGPRGH